MATGATIRVLSVGRCGARGGAGQGCPAHRTLQQHRIEFLGWHGVFEEAEGAVIVEFAGGAEESGGSDSTEGTADADALHADVSKFINSEAERDSGQHVDGTVHGADQRFYLLTLGDTGCEEHVCSSLLEGLEPANGFADVGTVVEIDLGSCGEHEGEAEGARRLGC